MVELFCRNSKNYFVSISAERFTDFAFTDFADYYEFSVFFKSDNRVCPRIMMNHPSVIIAARSDTAFCAVIYQRKQGSGATCVYEAGRVECTVLYSYVLIAAIVSPSRR